MDPFILALRALKSPGFKMDVRNPAGTGWKQNGASKMTFGSSHMHHFPARIFNHGIMVIQLPIHADSSCHSDIARRWLPTISWRRGNQICTKRIHSINASISSVREHFSGRLRWTWFDAQPIWHSGKPNIATSRPWFVQLVVCLLGFCWGFLKHQRSNMYLLGPGSWAVWKCEMKCWIVPQSTCLCWLSFVIKS